MAGVVAAAGAPVVLMHMRGSPSTMQADPSYLDVTREVARELRQALVRAEEAGIPQEQTVVDPGLGFGKTPAHNLTLLRRLGELRSLGRPILVGASRKSFLGHLLGLEVGDRAWASALVHTVSVLQGGAAMVRAHDVAITRQALDLAAVLRGEAEESPL